MVSPRFSSHVKGNGPIQIDIWLDYICPFSKKQFLSLDNDIIPKVEEKFPGRFSWVFQHQVQPWHAQGVWLHETAIAVSLLAPEKFWSFSKYLFEISDNYYDHNTKNRSRSEIVDELAELAAKFTGVGKNNLIHAIEISGTNGETRVTPDIKAYVKLNRQTGVHVSPTVLIDGLFANDVSSSWTADQWLEKLGTTDRLTTTKI